jgi:hypothetical protein
MNNIRIIESKTDVAETIANFQADASRFDGVILLGIDKEGAQYLMTSTMSAMQKSFLCQFLNAWMVKWFRLDSE